ncbi:MAG: M28 family peptidase [Bacteroidota bacterium]
MKYFQSKLKKIILLLSAFWATNISIAQDTTIQNILNDVRIDSIMHFVEELSGEIPTVINGVSQIITSRHKDEPGNEMAFVYIKQKLNSYSLQPDSQVYNTTCKNIFASQAGTVFPGKKYIICAHYDDMPAGSIAPGADDNASGTATVIEAARIFSQYSFPFTIVYALWDEEEQGLVGSSIYAAQAAADDDLIMGVINMDMIAWDSDNDNLAFIHTKNIRNSVLMADTMNNINSTYNIGLDIVIKNPGVTATDHASFWNEYYSAIGLSEDYYGDMNAYYHSTDDLIAYFKIPYYEKTSKLAIATLACLASDTSINVGIEELSHERFILYSNYPNPFSYNTTISYSLPFQCKVNITIYNLLGNKIEELVAQEQQAGNYEVSWNAAGFSSGIYYYELNSISTDENKIFRKVRKLNLVK